MSVVSPSISPSVISLAPEFTAISIAVTAAPVIDESVGRRRLTQAVSTVLDGQPTWALEHFAQWSEVFRAFGAKPKRTPCSAEALHKRVMREGEMASIDPIVDLYNAVSLSFAVPVGGENLNAYQGSPRLLRATGSEPFDTVQSGNDVIEYPEPGEVIWADDRGVTCRRWNWRQGSRTRLSVEDQQMWFILESLPAMPFDALQSAAKMLTDGLDEMMPGCHYQLSTLNAASVS
ncbi:B3/4 domain-containing protein [Rosenbergiella nectarea]|uniref:B3/B4 domain-containing protein n=1 Tax=Rosenbergiella nectarea TaxID=988801 RepID=UPI001BDA5059|nr:phenylalanine--tRNA ligase beta subunit-related protein [Rosenbergiella nectarea]MBT0729969.1 hypothetical protein [Rosenbergiella nectarea subsp. apis]